MDIIRNGRYYLYYNPIMEVWIIKDSITNLLVDAFNNFCAGYSSLFCFESKAINPIMGTLFKI